MDVQPTSAPQTQPSPPRDIVGTLPLDVALVILKQIPAQQLYSLAYVSKRWLAIIARDALWLAPSVPQALIDFGPREKQNEATYVATIQALGKLGRLNYAENAEIYNRADSIVQKLFMKYNNTSGLAQLEKIFPNILIRYWSYFKAIESDKGLLAVAELANKHNDQCNWRVVKMCFRDIQDPENKLLFLRKEIDYALQIHHYDTALSFLKIEFTQEGKIYRLSDEVVNSVLQRLVAQGTIDSDYRLSDFQMVSDLTEI